MLRTDKLIQICPYELSFLERGATILDYDPDTQASLEDIVEDNRAHYRHPKEKWGDPVIELPFSVEALDTIAKGFAVYQAGRLLGMLGDMPN